MRKPGGMGLLELQDQERKGRFNELSMQPQYQVQKDQGYLGLDSEKVQNNPLQNIGEVSYPRYNFDDRFTDLEVKKFSEIFNYLDRDGNN